MNDPCESCKEVPGSVENACSGLCRKEMYYNGDLDDVSHLEICNCCAQCRQKCEYDAIESIDEEDNA